MSSRSPGTAYRALDQHADSPFNSEPLVASTSSAVASPTNPMSMTTASPTRTSTSQRSPPSSPSSRNNGSSMSTGSMATASSQQQQQQSALVGQRSLMGILGGTRYEPRDVDYSVREEEEEEEGDIDLSKLPPPPSVSDSSSSSEEDDEDEPPPDLTDAASKPTRSKPKATTSPERPLGTGGRIRLGGPEGLILEQLGRKERALWRWVNVADMDLFLQEVYCYYVGKGIWTILLARAVSLLTVAWVVLFSTFLGGCVEYAKITHSHSLNEVVVQKCFSHFSGSALLFALLGAAFFVHRLVDFGVGIKSLRAMHDFYEELLEIPETDIASIPWSTLVEKLSTLRAAHPSALTNANTGVFDAHDIANRIMREENYLIALFNKEILKLTLPLPMPSWTGRLQNGQLTKTLEWNLRFCLTTFFFDPKGQLRRAFLSERNRHDLALTLRKRFQLLAVLNAVLAPFIVLYLLVYSFFRYFEEYHKNPSTIGMRSFTPLSRWQFREFNELPHLFLQRLNRAQPLAESYVSHFPRERTAVIARFVAFVAGSIAAVLILFSLLDPDAFLHFEITKDRTVLFWIGITGAIVAVARGMIPDDKQTGHPESIMNEIIEHTHYCPQDWRGRLHSAYVHAQFSQMFRMKVALFFEELASVVLTPLVLWKSLPSSSLAIIDFFREFTIHVDGLGYVCSFAVFDFKRHGDPKYGAPVEAVGGTDGRSKRWRSNEGKMEKSFLNFTAHNPHWAPRDQAQSLFLSRMTESMAAVGANGPSQALSPPLTARLALSRHPGQLSVTPRTPLAATGDSGHGRDKPPASLKQKMLVRSMPPTTRRIVERSALDGEEYVDHNSPDRQFDIEEEDEDDHPGNQGPADFMKTLYNRM